MMKRPRVLNDIFNEFTIYYEIDNKYNLHLYFNFSVSGPTIIF